MESKRQKGIGVDIGTMFVKTAYQKEKNIVFRSQRNAFFGIEHTDFTQNILDKAKVQYIIKGSEVFVVGNQAIEFSNMFSKELRRPLSKGVVSPEETYALPIIELLIKNVVGTPLYEGETVYFSVPAEPVDADYDVIYHTMILKQFLKALKFDPKPINEAHAVVLSELSKEDFTGIGISWGGGMVNVCMALNSVPTKKFSISKSGDWIDQQSARVTNETASKIAQFKEKKLDFTKPATDKMSGAISIYYNHLIEYVIETMKSKFKDVPDMNTPLKIVLSGGTSLVPGFDNKFKEILNTIKMPFEIGDVVMANEPLKSPSKGALIAAKIDENKKG
jgi:actin-like ATPase involved in cell morphogenesis